VTDTLEWSDRRTREPIVNGERAKRLYESLCAVAACTPDDELWRLRKLLRVARTPHERQAIDRWLTLNLDPEAHSDDWPEHIRWLQRITQHVCSCPLDVEEVREVMRLARTREAWPAIDRWLADSTEDFR